MRMAQPDGPRHFLKAWRKHRGLSQKQACDAAYELVSDRVIAEGEEGDMRRLGLSQGNLSRMEKGEIPYNQFALEILAEVYQTDPASLIMRDPEDDEVWSIYDRVPKTVRPQALKVLETFAEPVDPKKTGTGG